MIDNQLAKNLLIALAQSLPDEGPSPLSGVHMQRGWGDVVNVRLHTTVAPTPDGRVIGVELSQAVSRALQGQRHAVDIVWGLPR
ncbi:MAG: hypothetical protein ACLPVF_13495 [Acidimicrobiales bacterium]